MAEHEIASLGAAEAEILKIVWELKQATVQQIWEKLPSERSITDATVQTVLRRLRDKGYVKSHLAGKAHVFSAAIKPERVIAKTVNDLVGRFFGGDALPLVMHLAKSRQIDKEDLHRLQDVLKKASQPKSEK
jgi:predicted transcriptional regulator